MTGAKCRMHSTLLFFVPWEKSVSGGQFPIRSQLSSLGTGKEGPILGHLYIQSMSTFLLPQWDTGTQPTLDLPPFFIASSMFHCF